MPNYVIKNKHIMKGSTGDRGDLGATDTTIPINGVVAFDGDEIPEGYILVYDTEGGE